MAREIKQKKRYEWIGVILFIIFALIMIIACVSSFLKGSYNVDMSDFASIHYVGFNGHAYAEVSLDRAGIEDEMELCYAKYDSAFFPMTKDYSDEDFIRLGQSINVSLDKKESLKNEDKICLTFSYDEELADELKVNFDNTVNVVKVKDLKDGREITDDELFKDLKFSVEGISPVISVTLDNNSKDEFISGVNFRITNEQNCFKNGDSIDVEASFNEEQALLDNIDIKSGVHSKKYQIDGFSRYVESTDEIPIEVLKEAVDEGKGYFGDALEYGLRIFTEANLYPDFSKGYEFSNPQLLSAYIEVLNDPMQMSATKPYNYLELCYEVYLSQPGGKGCKAEAIVCFSNIIIDSKGNCILDKTTGKLFSASHNDRSIKKSINEWFGSEYQVEKFEVLPE